MNIRFAYLVTTLVLLVGVFSSGTASADPLSDLTVTDIKVNAQCQIEIDIKNLGPGAMPETAFYVGTQPYLRLYKDNQESGGWDIARRALQPAGGTYTHVVQALNQRVSGTHSYRVELDKNNIVPEANENNNSMTRSLSCSPPLPDLAVTKISFNKDCTARVTLKNVGTANYPNTSFASVNLFRIIDGASKGYMRLRDIDPNSILKAPGGELVWTDLPNFKATTSAKYMFTGSGLIAEENTANNSLTANIPAEGCGATVKRSTLPRHSAPRYLEPKLKRKIVP